ncbi:hypothetical protein [Clostridium sp. ZBS13]|uniref:hypothetical protein n=1 Tax=Clostridium sp. ZBS13 TaxID=2949971 RepID=UPI002079A53A|nr:hypothetical protein [Clostridium sp. ZBS13]
MKEYIVDNENNKMRYHDLPGKDTPILFIRSAGHSMAWENPKGLAESIKKGILYARKS